MKRLLYLLGLLPVSVGWGAAPTTEELARIPVNPHAVAYYKEHPEFFRFSSLADLPPDLDWQDGSDQEPFASPDATIGGTVRGAISSYPPTLRRLGPNANSSFRGFHYDYNMVSLVEIHPNTKAYLPGLAREWAVGKDGRSAYFRLDPDARFTDGQPITTDDFFFTFFFMQSEWIIAPWYNNYYGPEFFEGIVKYDDHTFSIHRVNPEPDPIYKSVIGPTCRTFFKDFGPNLEGGFPGYYQWKFEPRTGPYVIREEDMVDGESIALTRVDHWWGDAKRFLKGRWNPERREYRVVREPDKIFQIFLQGGVDFFGLDLPNYWYDRTDKPEFHKGYIQKATFYNDLPRPTWGLYINSASGYLADQDVRIGLQHATDWQRVIDVYFRGDYQRLQGYNQGYGRFTNPDIRARRYDPMKAREAFARAGFTEVGRDGILRNQDGDKLSFRLTMRQGESKKFLAFIVDSARRAGVEYRPEVLDGTTSYNKVMEKNHEVVFWAWGVGGRYPRYWEGFHMVNAVTEDDDGNRVRKRQTNNITLTVNQEMSDLIDAYRKAETEEQMVGMSHTLQQMIHDEGSYIPGYYQPWYRLGYWRWMRFPEHFDMRDSDGPLVYQLYWIDEARKQETLKAMEKGQTFEPVNETYDQWRAQ